MVFVPFCFPFWHPFGRCGLPCGTPLVALRSILAHSRSISVLVRTLVGFWRAAEGVTGAPIPSLIRFIYGSLLRAAEDRLATVT
jgi:hypothetical protein